ncbi:MAG TPA: cupredoxin domain-containing protein [Accumulibacter sp.]|uniref:cupredoxin domain-containing protein n=2 Tax=Accumulibacter sp. TaxID=2053492 RepID=UPI0025CF7158|nr:cupredoxin domain-containing protein [Accumulibacter sp.]MCM8664562.1 cupredoxin domain-containing protein [Accumulibacter sp.]HNC53570.1 cupredoxin domain-containing protein [Accumulibacter sp.]
MFLTRKVLLTAALLALPVAALAGEAEFAITIKDHRFDPAEVRVPAGQKIKLVVKNDDKTAEEFESKPLKREKIIQGGASATIVIGPLKPGSYPFYGEFHEATAKGVIIAE